MEPASTLTEQSPTRVGTFESLRIRNFRLFFGGQLISQIGNWLTLIAQALLVLKLTDSGIALGLLAACQFGPVLVLGAWAGLVADRSDKRKLLLDRADLRHGAVVRAGVHRLHGSPVGRGDLRGCHARGCGDGVRQPGTPRLRRRDGSRSQRAERSQPQQRVDDRGPRRRSGAGRVADHDRRLWMDVRGRRRVVPRRDPRLGHDAHPARTDRTS